MNWNEYILAFIALFAIVDPVGSVPLFLAFTENLKEQRPRIARTVCLGVASVLILTVLAGGPILGFFNISLDAFRIAGGILLLIVSLNMLQARRGRARQTPEEAREAIDSTSVAIVPLTMPLLAGPGAISTVILFNGQMETMIEKSGLILICALIALITGILFYLAPRIEQHLSTTGVNIVMRVMGLILAAISVEFIAVGLKALLPGLA